MSECVSIQSWAAHLIVAALFGGMAIGFSVRVALDYAELRTYRRIAELSPEEIRYGVLWPEQQAREHERARAIAKRWKARAMLEQGIRWGGKSDARMWTIIGGVWSASMVLAGGVLAMALHLIGIW
jgi:hypothetical protein